MKLYTFCGNYYCHKYYNKIQLSKTKVVILIINLIKLKTTMDDDDKKCTKCGHEHTKTDGTCECGCGGE